MVYCWKCGTKNDDDAEFCKKCGSNLKDTRRAFEKELKSFTEDIGRGAEIVGKKAEELGKDLAKKAKKFVQVMVREANDFGKSVEKSLRTNPKHCKKCGAKLLPGSEFCSKCGKQVFI